jgi:heterodisulfide reductase subunit B2
MDVAYYPGCSLHASSALYDNQSQRIFKELGINLKEIDDWNCCGATSAGKTDDFLSVAMPARNIGIAESTGLDEILIPCSACYSRTLVAQKRLEKEEGMLETMNSELARPIKNTIKISSILEMLLPKVKSGELKEKAVNNLEDIKPVCYYGCMMTRFPVNVDVPDNVENPQGMEKILKALGANAIDWNGKTDCCGASAAVNDNGTSINLMAKIMQDAVSRGANCFVTTCPMCQLNLDMHQEKFCEQASISQRLPVYFITELIGIAMGISPQELQIDRHFTESISLLKELKLA